MKCIEKCGNIVKIFYFDIKLAINILIAKAKYIMINYYRKNHDNKTMYYDAYENNYLDHITLLRDDKNDPQMILD